MDISIHKNRVIEIAGDLPPTLNEQLNHARSGWQVATGVKKKWTQYVAKIASNHEPFSSQIIWVEYHWYLKSFSRDCDNVAAASKFINDGVVEAGIIRNDNLTVIQSPVTHYYHRDSADRFVLRISDDRELLTGKVFADAIDNLC